MMRTMLWVEQRNNWIRKQKSARVSLLYRKTSKREKMTLKEWLHRAGKESMSGLEQNGRPVER